MSPRLLSRHRLLAAVVSILLVGACNQTATAPEVSGTTPNVSPGVSESPAPAASTAGAGLPAGQTDSKWGRIWDDIPAMFPIYPGAVPAGEAQTGPISATFALDGGDARTIAAWIQTELERAAYRTEALNGPFEDGSFVLESTGAADCRIEVTVAPLGSLTTMTVRYGAACPSP